MQGRILLLEESCRRAFSVDGDRRSHVDLQALKAWFQTTKLKVTTDFERLQPVEVCHCFASSNCSMLLVTLYLDLE
jgi:hypothetical protein